jgi:hypothetical protein
VPPHDPKATSSGVPVSEKAGRRDAMPIAEYVASVQTNGPESQTSNSSAGLYFALALVAVVLGLLVVVFIKTSMRRSSRR